MTRDEWLKHMENDMIAAYDCANSIDPAVVQRGVVYAILALVDVLRAAEMRHGDGIAAVVRSYEGGVKGE